MQRILILTTALLATSAWAQEDIDAQSGRAIKYLDRTEVIFDLGLDIEAGLLKPSGATVTERGRPTFAPMFALRRDFEQEMRRSIDEVK